MIESETPTPQPISRPKKGSPAAKQSSRRLERRLSGLERKVVEHVASIEARLDVIEKRLATTSQIYQTPAVGVPMPGAVDFQTTMINTTRSCGTPPQPVNNKPPEPVKILDEQTFRINARMRGEIVEGLARERDRPPGASKQ